MGRMRSTKGSIADAIVKASSDKGGILAKADFENMRFASSL
jgi:gamma-glutamyltranspeptidase